MTSRFIAFGMLFGFLLSRVGATSFDAIHGMFRLSDLHLVGVIGVAIAVAAIGFVFFKRRRAPEAAVIKPKPMQRGLVMGGLLFGAGWALTGTCPGTALAQLGEGTLAGGVTVLGIAAGAYLQGRLGQRKPRSAAEAPGQLRSSVPV